MNILACDLGGTKVLLGIYEVNKSKNVTKLLKKEKYLSKEWNSFDLILQDFLDKKCNNFKYPNTACLGVAGPVKNQIAQITNLNWEINQEKITHKFNLEKVELVNDFAVLIYGIPFLGTHQFKVLQDGNSLINNNKYLHTIIGAGTGLGISRGLINDENIEVLSSEGGHMEFAPRTNIEWEIKEWIKKNLHVERVSCERVISGEGLSNIARWRFDKDDVLNHPFKKLLNSKNSYDFKKQLASKICEKANEGDPIMIEIEKIWLDCYSSFIGDVALHELCYGGLWIAGGTAPKHSDNFCSDSFLKQFLNKGRLKDIVSSIPVKVILDEDFGLYSAACRAQMLLKET